MVARAKWEKFSTIFCNISTKRPEKTVIVNPNYACHCEK